MLVGDIREIKSLTSHVFQIHTFFLFLFAHQPIGISTQNRDKNYERQFIRTADLRGLLIRTESIATTFGGGTPRIS